MCKCHHQLNLRLLDSFLKGGSDWGQFFTICAILELVTQATPQTPNFSIWNFVYPLEYFIYLFNKRLFLHNFSFDILQEHWWNVSSPPPAEDWAVPAFSLNFCLQDKAWSHSWGLGKSLMYPVPLLLAGCERSLLSSLSPGVSLLSCSSWGPFLAWWHFSCSVKVAWASRRVLNAGCCLWYYKGAGKAGGSCHSGSIKRGEDLPWICVISWRALNARLGLDLVFLMGYSYLPQ